MSVITVNLFKKLETVEPSLREVLLAILEEIEKQQKERVTKDEFRELKDIVAELAQAQKKTEQRVNELVEAQKKTEQRLDSLTQKVNELAEAQKKTEQRLDSLTQKVNELAEAQKKTEQQVNELAKAQKKTEQEIYNLVKRMDVFEERLEGISNSVGYSLENTTYKALPKILLQRYEIEVTDRLLRKYFPVGKKNIQLNIYGHGKRDCEDLVIIGECKVRPSKREITRFKKYAEKVAELEGKKPFYIFVAHDFPPEIEEFLQSNDISYIWSYELE